MRPGRNLGAVGARAGAYEAPSILHWKVSDVASVALNVAFTLGPFSEVLTAPSVGSVPSKVIDADPEARLLTPPASVAAPAGIDATTVPSLVTGTSTV